MDPSEILEEAVDAIPATESVAGYDFVQMVSCRDKSAAWRILTEAFISNIVADEYAFWLVDAANTESLKLGDWRSQTRKPSLQGDEKRELLDYARSLDELVVSARVMSKGPNSILDRLMRTLFEKPAYSLLCVLFKDRHANLLGILVLAKCEVPPDPQKTLFAQHFRLPRFNLDDENIARQLTRGAAPVLDLLRSLKLLRDMRKAIHGSGSKRDIFDNTVLTARKLLRAKSGDVLPPEGDAPAIVGSDSAKQLRVPLTWDERSETMGILTIGAATSGSKNDERSFDERDQDLLEWVARHASSDCQLVEKKLHLESWQASLAELTDPAEIAENLIAKLIECMGSDRGSAGGVVYRSYPRTDRLFSFAAISKTRDVRKEPYVFQVHKEESAAIYAYSEGSFHCDPDDSRVNQDGRKAFGFGGSVFALPLGAVGEMCFGSVVVWFYEEQLDEVRRDALLPVLQGIVDCAVSPLRFALFSQTDEYRRNFHGQVARILQQLMGDCDLDTILADILKAIEKCGFTRVRLFDFRFGDTLVGRSAIGMEREPSEFGGAKPYKIRVCDNEYTKNMYDRFCQARMISRKPLGDAQASDFLLARMCPIRFDDGVYLADSMGPAMGKPPGMPWAEVPIVAAGKLYGVIAADKLQVCTGACEARWGDITDFELDAIDVFAQLASRAYAMNDRRGTLVQRHLATLNGFLALPDEAADVPKSDIGLVRRRMLMFVTHGEHGLGFNRALMFVPNKEDPESGYRFLCGVGATTEEIFTDCADAAREQSLLQVLTDASLQDDAELNEHFRGSTIAPLQLGSPAETGSEVLWFGGPKSPSSDAFATMKLLLDNDEFMVAPMRTASHDLGLLVADRRWVPKPGLSSADAESLAAFARHGAQFLFQYQELSLRYEDFENFATGIAHEFRDPLKSLQDSVRAIDDTTVRELSSLTNRLGQPIAGFSRRLESLDKVFSRKFSRDMLDLEDLVAIIKKSGSGLLPDNIQFDVTKDIPSVSVSVHSDAIRLVFDNLLRNSVEALENSDRESKTVCLDVASIDGKVRISVRDNGPGVTPQTLATLRRRITIAKHAGENGYGWGLFGCRWIARKHDGQLELASSWGESFTASIVLPVSTNEETS